MIQTIKNTAARSHARFRGKKGLRAHANIIGNVEDTQNQLIDAALHIDAEVAANNEEIRRLRARNEELRRARFSALAVAGRISEFFTVRERRQDNGAA